QRHDYKVKENTVKSRKLNVTLKKNNLWPEINLTASLTNNGLGDHFSDSIGNISDEDNSNLFAGLKINIPLENTKARAQLQGAKLEDVRALLDLKYVERTITTEIKDGVRNCNILREVAVNHEEIAGLQAQKLEEEFKRFDSGRSDTDTVIRFKEDLLESQRKAARAKNTYQQALIDLRVKEGGLLNKYWKEEL
ncbi:MAG: TolC family protein, partial [Candidatus Omnitrophica bacterium]|nr:TolC family protein [Candidatus Omnitrophota bacterium]